MNQKLEKIILKHASPQVMLRTFFALYALNWGLFAYEAMTRYTKYPSNMYADYKYADIDTASLSRNAYVTKLGDKESKPTEKAIIDSINFHGIKVYLYEKKSIYGKK